MKTKLHKIFSSTLLLFVLCFASTANAIPFIGHWTTGEHNIRISYSYTEGLLYEAWNAPKGIGQGRPNWKMTHGVANQNSERSCIRFTKGITTFQICDTPHHGTYGELRIFLRNKLKEHYWLYSLD